jgi:hypothetical protein
MKSSYSEKTNVGIDFLRAARRLPGDLCRTVYMV